MRIAVISDLHVGGRGHTDGFRHRRDDFLRFLDALEAEHDVVVLAGDVYHCDHGLLPPGGLSAEQLARARGRVPWLVERLSRPIYRTLFGNHDAVAAQEGVPEHLLLTDGGPRVLVIHGHQFDPVLTRAPAAAALATWTMGRLRAAGLRPLAEWAEGRDVAIKASRFEGEGGPYTRGVRAWMRRLEADFAVMGHTHVPSRRAVAEGVIANCGTCSRGRFMAATLDTDRRAVEVEQRPP